MNREENTNAQDRDGEEEACDDLLKVQPMVCPHPTRVQLPAHERVTSVSCGAQHTALVTASGCLYMCGSNCYGQLGLGHREDEFIPKLVCSLADATNRSDEAGGAAGLGPHAPLEAGSSGGELEEEATHVPVLSAACGDGHTLAVRSDGSVWAFGKHEDGQLGVRARSPCLERPACLYYLVFQGLSAWGVQCGGDSSAVLLRGSQHGDITYRLPPLDSPLLSFAQVRDGWELEGRYLVFGNASSVSAAGADKDDPWDRPPQGHYGWDDGFAEMRVIIPVEGGLSVRHVHVEISRTRLVVALHSKGLCHQDLDAATAPTAPTGGTPDRSDAVGSGARPAPVVDVDLFARVDPSGSWWQLEDRAWYYGSQRRCLVVTLSKAIRSPWLALEPIDASATDEWWHPKSDAWQSSYAPREPLAAAQSSKETHPSPSLPVPCGRPAQGAVADAPVVDSHRQSPARGAAPAAHRKGCVAVEACSPGASQEGGQDADEDADSGRESSSRAEEGPHLALKSPEAHDTSEYGSRSEPDQDDVITDFSPREKLSVDDQVERVVRSRDQRSPPHVEKNASRQEEEEEEEEEEKALGAVEAGELEDLGSAAVAAWLKKDDHFKSSESEEDLHSCKEDAAKTRCAEWPRTIVDWDNINLPSMGTTKSVRSESADSVSRSPSQAAGTTARGSGDTSPMNFDGDRGARGPAQEEEQIKLQAQMDADWEELVQMFSVQGLNSKQVRERRGRVPPVEVG